MKNTLAFFLVLALCCLPVCIADNVANPPGTVSQQLDGDLSWQSLDNIKLDDGLYASSLSSVFFSGDLATNTVLLSGFGYSIPSTAVINGVVVEMERAGISGMVTDARLVLYDTLRHFTTGDQVSEDRADTSEAWPGTFGVKSYGGVDDLWGMNLTPAVINYGGFSIRFSATLHGALSAPEARVDYVRMIVYYTPAPPAPSTRPRRRAPVVSQQRSIPMLLNQPQNGDQNAEFSTGLTSKIMGCQAIMSAHNFFAHYGLTEVVDPASFSPARCSTPQNLIMGSQPIMFSRLFAPLLAYLSRVAGFSTGWRSSSITA